MPQREVPEGSVVISPQDVYTEVMQLTRVVGELVAKDQHDPLPARVQAHEQESKERYLRLDERVRSLERRVWMVSGAAAVMGSGIGSLIAPKLGG